MMSLSGCHASNARNDLSQSKMDTSINHPDQSKNLKVLQD